jgi:hypothetical protein
LVRLGHDGTATRSRQPRGHFGAAVEVMDRDGDVDIVVRK